MRKATILIILALLIIQPIFASAQGTNYRFTGQELDAESGLYNFKAREYNPSNGRFLQQDPVAVFKPEEYLADPQQLNSYSYTRNNPVRFVDPTGETRADYNAPVETPKVGERSGKYKGVQLYAGRGTVQFSQSQCVVGVQRLYKELFDINLAYGLGSAVNYADLNKVSKGAISHYEQGSSVMPQENDIITWAGGTDSVGHIGMISEVVYDPATGKGMVYTVEQNHRLGDEDFGYAITGKVGANGQMHYNIEGFGSYAVKSWQRPANGSTTPSPVQLQPAQQQIPEPQSATQTHWYNKLWNSFKNIFSDQH